MSDSDWRAGLRESGPYVTLGLQMGLTVAVCTLGGFFADRHFGTLPWLTLAGGLLGIVALVVQLVRAVRDINAASTRRASRR